MQAFLAAEKINADKPNTQPAQAPTTEPISLPFVNTDMGGLTHLFSDPISAVEHAVATPIAKATSSLRGPNGGLIPSGNQLVSRIRTSNPVVDGEHDVERAFAAPVKAGNDLLKMLAGLRTRLGL